MGNLGDLAATAVSKELKTTIEILVMRIQTRFTTEDQFVAAFRRFCTESTCFIPSTEPRAVGIETGFSIRLADGTPMLRGLCVVLESWTTDDNPYRRPGVRLGLRTLTRETKPIFDRIQTARSIAIGSSPDLAAQLAEELERKTVEMPPLFPDLPAEDCTHEDAREAVADGIPLPIDPQDTERYLAETMPMRAPAPTLLGVAPIAIPRTLTPRERVTMPALTATGTQTVVAKPMPVAIVVRRRSWWNRVVWRMRAWWRMFVWARRRSDG